MVIVMVGSVVGGLVGTVVVNSVVGTVVGTVVGGVTGSRVTGGGMVMVGVSPSAATGAATAAQRAHNTRVTIRIAQGLLTVSLPVLIHQATAIYMRSGFTG
jgi:hypothetical protein